MSASPGERPRPDDEVPDRGSVTRGASKEALDRPAGDFLAAIPWDGPSPNPDTLDGPTFLAWL